MVEEADAPSPTIEGLETPIRNVLRDVTSPLQSELRPLRFIARWKVLLIAVQFRYNKPHIDFIALIITRTLPRMKRSPSQVQGSLCFLIGLMEVWN